jgi:hypothetical protein
LPDQVRLVEGLCAPGGLRAQPAREDLRLFVERVGSLNGPRVAQLLQAKMVRAACTLRSNFPRVLIEALLVMRWAHNATESRGQMTHILGACAA